MVEFRRRLATGAELSALFELHRDALKEHVQRLWGSWDDDWQRQNFQQECAESCCEVIVKGDALLGYVQHVSDAEHVRIWNIVLSPEFRGRGVGSRIVQEFQELARGRNAEIGLRVFPGNLAALRFYERLGFREVSRTSTGIELTWRAS